MQYNRPFSGLSEQVERGLLSFRATALHKDLLVLLEKKKLNIKSAHYLSCLDIEAEQLWVLRFYKKHGVFPKIKQAKKIKETYDGKKLTLASLHAIMETSLQPKKLVFDYADFTLFFQKGTPPQQMKEGTLKVLMHWENNSK